MNDRKGESPFPDDLERNPGSFGMPTVLSCVQADRPICDPGCGPAP